MQTMSIGENIERCRKAAGINQSELARQVGVSPQTVQQWESGDTSPRRHRIKSIATALGTTISEIEYGHLSDSGALVAESATHYTDNVSPTENTKGSKVPLISWVQAGNWDEAIDEFHPGDAETFLPCPVPHGPRTYALRVAGDSMTSPYGKSYPSGSIIYVDPDQAGGVANGERVIAKLEGENAVTFKQFTEDAGRRYLKPLNPAYPIITEPFRILGRVIAKVEPE